MQKGKITFARHLGSYPILVGIVGNYERNRFLDAKVTDHGMRSITAIEYPLNINKARMHQIEAITGIGNRTAARIVRNSPFESLEALKRGIGDELYHKLKDFVCV